MLEPIQDNDNFCMWLVIIIILDGFLHGNFEARGLGENLSFWLKNHQF
jgi:hypothetical protein